MFQRAFQDTQYHTTIPDQNSGILFRIWILDNNNPDPYSRTVHHVPDEFLVFWTSQNEYFCNIFFMWHTYISKCNNTIAFKSIKITKKTNKTYSGMYVRNGLRHM